MLDVMSDFLWILGVSGALATISYGSWYRALHHRSWRYVFSVPRFLFPLCLSSTFICSGAALSGRYGVTQVAWYETLVWAVLAAVFARQSVAYYLAGVSNGWETSTEGMPRP